MRLAAMSSIALVIFFVDWTDLILRRRTRSWPPAMGLLLALGRVGRRQEVVHELRQERLQPVLVLDLAGRADAVAEVAVADLDPLEQVGLEALHVGDGHRVE